MLWAVHVVQELGTPSHAFFLWCPNRTLLFMLPGIPSPVISHGEMTLLKHGLFLHDFLLVPHQLFLRSFF